MLKLVHASKIYHESGVCALRGIDLTVARGDYVSITGASGSGKSTLMHVLGLLDTLTDGRYLLEGEDVSRLPPRELARLRSERIGFVFQRFQLIPGMDALENVALPLALQGVPRAERLERAAAALDAVGLSDRLAHKPGQLSGGQQQRVAIARTLVLSPDIILFDEPMSALDVATRLSLRREIREIRKEFGTTMIYVTHDQEEAFAMSDRVMVMREAHIVQLDRPEVIVNSPADEYVKSFVVDNLRAKIDSLSKYAGGVKDDKDGE